MDMVKKKKGEDGMKKYLAMILLSLAKILINTFLMIFMFSGGTSLRPSEYGAHWLLGETTSCPLSKILLCCEGV